MTNQRSRRAVFPLVLFVATLLDAALLVGQRQGIVIETQVVRVPVTVVDRRRRFVTGLQQDEFELLEDDVPQQLTSFAVEEASVTAVLLIDVSESMTSRLAQAKRAAGQFVRQLGPNDLVKVVAFDDTVRTIVDFTSDTKRVEAELQRVRPGGATALHDALWTALASLEKRRATDEAAQRHRAIVILSDGDDTASGLRFDEVFARARRVDAIVSSLSLNRVANGPALDAPSTVFLRGLADLTGGQLLFPDIDNLERAYQDLADELRHQYTLGYVPTNTDARLRYHRITVRVKNRPNLVLRHRQGYLEDR